MKLLVALVVALAICAADGRIRRLFGSQDAQVRIYTALNENSASAADGDCFVGKCPFDVTMPFLMGDVCPQVAGLTAAADDKPIDFTTGDINLEGLFKVFFSSKQCPTDFTTIFGTAWNTYTANLEVPIYMQFIEAGVLGGNYNKQCPADRTTCGSHPNGVVRLNFIFDNFCESTCVFTPDPPTPTPVNPPPGPPAPPGPPGPPGPPAPPGPPGPAPPGPPGPPAPPGPPIGTGLGPIDVPPGGITPAPPPVIVMPNPPPIITGTKDAVSSASMLQVSFFLPLLAALLAMVF